MFRVIAYFLTLIGALAGGVQFFYTLIFANSAPQQAAGVAMALGWAILPFIFMRAIDAIAEAPEDLGRSKRKISGGE